MRALFRLVVEEPSVNFLGRGSGAASLGNVTVVLCRLRHLGLYADAVDSDPPRLRSFPAIVAFHVLCVRPSVEAYAFENSVRVATTAVKEVRESAI